MKAFFILSYAVIFSISAVQAGSFIDLDFSGLSTLSKSNKKLTKMVEMQKKLDDLPIVISDHNKSETKENNISDKKEDNTTALRHSVKKVDKKTDSEKKKN